MSFYDLSLSQRQSLVNKIEQEVLEDLLSKSTKRVLRYFSDDDTYVRKAAYIGYGRIYLANKVDEHSIYSVLENLLKEESASVKQTVINALGEIGKKDSGRVLEIYELALKDKDHEVRNAVIGSLKKMGEKNPKPVLEFARKYLHDPDPEIRRQILHGIELRGRSHPEDILPLLRDVQSEQNKRVRNVIVHVLGQISYKKGCLEKVVKELKTWENKELVNQALNEILETHKSYEKFSAKSYSEAKSFIASNFTIS